MKKEFKKTENMVNDEELDQVAGGFSLSKLVYTNETDKQLVRPVFNDNTSAGFLLLDNEGNVRRNNNQPSTAKPGGGPILGFTPTDAFDDILKC